MSESVRTRCPGDEVLAAFVEGALDPRSRTAVERHVADCPECLFVVGGTAQVLAEDIGTSRIERPLRWRWLVAAAVLVAVVAPSLLRQVGDRRDPLRRLRRAAAEADTRPVEGRLAGFEYAPFVRRRAASPTPAGDFVLRAEAERIEAARGHDAQSVHARGIAALLTGGAARGIPDLERAVASDPLNAGIWNDLAVARDAAAHGARDVMRVRALAAADRAVEIAPLAPWAHFTRAVVLEHLGRGVGAVDEYRRAAALDDDPGWRREALSRISHLR